MIGTGTRLGPYEILAPLGAGGMEVYCATDTNLARQIAIKVLPASVAEQASETARGHIPGWTGRHRRGSTLGRGTR